MSAGRRLTRVIGAEHMATLITSSGEEKELTPAAPPAFTLEELQSAVGGTIAIYAVLGRKNLVCNDDGLSLKLPLNAKATELYNAGRDTEGWGVSPVVGDVLICTPQEID